MSEEAIIKDPGQILEIIRVGFRDQNKFAIWQEEKGSTRGQPFCWGKIIGIKKEGVEIKLEYVKKVRINQNNSIFLYGYKNKIVCKIPIIKMGLNLLIVPIPKEIMNVDDNYLEKKNVISKEDEKKFMIQRAEARSVSEGNNFTQFKKTGLYQKKSKKFRLYDLSPNGMSFLIQNPEGFEAEESIEIITINQREFEPPLFGVIRSIREMDDGQYKVGIEFKSSAKKAAS